MSEEQVRGYEGKIMNLRTVGIGKGVHYLQEDNPHSIRKEVAGWIGGL